MILLFSYTTTTMYRFKYNKEATTTTTTTEWMYRLYRMTALYNEEAAIEGREGLLPHAAAIAAGF